MFTREEIIAAALNLTRKGGISALTARALGVELGSSSRPIFGLFKNMEEVQQEVFRAADALYQSYLKEGMGNISAECLQTDMKGSKADMKEE